MNVEAQDRESSLLEARRVRELALEAGFAESGMVALPHIHETRDADRYKSWVKAGHAGSMSYLRRAESQGEWCRAAWRRAVSVGPDGGCVPWRSYHAAQPRSTDAASRDAGWIARYAWSSRVDAKGNGGPATITVLLKRLRKLEAQLQPKIRRI
jgi:epoxyqueuosine reductase